VSDSSETTGMEEERAEGAEQQKAPLRPLAQRLLDTIVSPGRMARTVADNPKWAGALLVCVVLVVLSVALLPYELFEAMQRRMMIQRGGPVQELPENARTIIRVLSIVGGGVGFTLVAFVGAAVTTFVYAFVLGDEGTYRQYLAVGVHAAIIPALAALMLVPMRIAAGDPQTTISVATFLSFLPRGLLYNILRAADVSQMWATLVVAQGVHAVDRRRSVRSAVAIQLCLFAARATLVGWVLARQGL
jgi:hypothetical protein